MQKRERPAQRAFLAIATLVSHIILKGKVFTSSFFRYEPSPWSKNSKPKGVSSLFHSNPYNYVTVVMHFDIKLSSCKNNFTPLAMIKTMKGQWKFHGWEASVEMIIKQEQQEQEMTLAL